MKLFLIFLIFVGAAQAEISSNTAKASLELKNYHGNPGFEQGKARWTASGGSFTINTTAANVGSGAASGAFDASGAQTLRGTAVAIPAGLYGKSCLGKINYKGGDANYTLHVRDGANTSLGSLVLATQSAFKTAIVSFTCPTSGSFYVGVEAGANAAVVYVDDVYLGENYSIGTAFQSWFVSANIGGANPSLGTGDVDPYAPIENGSLTMTINSGSLTTQIPCATGTASSGTTCTAANEGIGVVYTQPVAGPVQACVSFNHYADIGSTTGVISTFQVVSTANSTTTIVLEGNSRVHSQMQTPGAVAVQLGHPIRVCGIFNFTTSGQKTLRLYYEQDTTLGTVNENLIHADGAGSAGQHDIHWEVIPIGQYLQ